MTVLPLMELTVVSVSDNDRECDNLQTEVLVFDGGSALRFISLIALAMSTTYLCSPSLNGELWSWLSSAPIMTRWFAIVLT